MTRAKSKSSSTLWAWGYAFAALALCGALALAWWQESTRPWQQEVAAINQARAERMQKRLVKAGMPMERARARTEALANEPPRVIEIVPTAFGRPERCLTCHQGIEQISPSHPVQAVGCIVCHGGQGLALTKTEAHRGLLGRNPSDLRTARASCGGGGATTRCHAGRESPVANMVYRVERTIMASMTGVLTSLRLAWGAQSEFPARFASAGISDPRRPHPAPPRTLAGLLKVPANQEGVGQAQLADEHWRKFCARCHLRSERKAGMSVHGQGCAACHGRRVTSGRYLGEDAAIPDDQPGHASYHRFFETPPEEQCRRCHNRSGRLALNYRGQMEDENGRTPWPQGKPRYQLSGRRGLQQLLPDVHADKGMSCIDCHSSRDIMGDGRIYGRMRFQNEMRCATCHGGPDGAPKTGPPDAAAKYEASYGPLKKARSLNANSRLLLSAKGRPLANLRSGPKGAVLLSRSQPGKRHKIPLISGDGRHQQPGHQRLACQACHSRWTPQCYGCHDYKKAKGSLWDYALGKHTPGRWQESRDLYRFTDPVLGLDSRGQIRPFVPGCQVVFTQLDQQGKPLPGQALAVARTKAVGSGIVSTPMAPHTSRTEVRPCEACHLNPKTLGLGSGPRPLGQMTARPLADLKAVGFSADWDALVNEQGQAIQGQTHQGARPLNKAEIAKVLRFGRCLLCHRKPGDPVLKNPDLAFRRIAMGGDLEAKHQAMVKKALQ
jgi:hypothetical protein